MFAYQVAQAEPQIQIGTTEKHASHAQELQALHMYSILTATPLLAFFQRQLCPGVSRSLIGLLRPGLYRLVHFPGRGAADIITHRGSVAEGPGGDSCAGGNKNKNKK